MKTQAVAEENTANSSSSYLSCNTLEKRFEFVCHTKQTQMYKDYHSFGSTCGYWGNERASTPDPKASTSKRDWDRLAFIWRSTLRLGAQDAGSSHDDLIDKKVDLEALRRQKAIIEDKHGASVDLRTEEVAAVKRHTGYAAYHSKGSACNYWGSATRAETPDPAARMSKENWKKPSTRSSPPHFQGN